MFSVVLLPDSDEEGDEHGADGISDHQVIFLHQQSRNDHTDAAQSVSDDVQKDTCNTHSWLSHIKILCMFSPLNVAYSCIKHPFLDLCIFALSHFVYSSYFKVLFRFSV